MITLDANIYISAYCHVVIPNAVSLIVASGKTLLLMRRNPAGWRIEDLQTVASELGIEWRRPRRGGSHVIFSAAGVREVASVPSKRPIKPVYVRQFLALIDSAGGMQ